MQHDTVTGPVPLAAVISQNSSQNPVSGAGSVTNNECRLISAPDLTESSPLWNELDNKDAVIFGSPT